MSDEQTEENATTEAVETAETNEQVEDVGDIAKVRKEAAERRVQLREVEAERDDLRAELMTFARRLGAGDFLTDPDVLPWSDDFVGEDQKISLEKISDAAKAYAAAHPHAAKVRGDVGQGHRGEATTGVDLAGMLRARA